MPNACRNASLAAIGLIALLELVACGGDSPGSGGGSGGAVGSGGGTGSGGSAAGSGGCATAQDLSAPVPQCNTVTNAAPTVAYSDGAGTVPVFAGGSIADGLYEATKAEGYNYPGKTGRRSTIVVQDGGTVFLWAGDVLDQAGTTVLSSYRFRTTMTTAGNQITPTMDCTNGGASLQTMSYTASPSQLTLAAGTASAMFVTTYTRRGCAP